MAFSHIQSAHNNGSGTSLVLTFGSNIGAGHLVVMGVYWATSGVTTISSITGDSDTYVQIGSTTVDGSSSQNTALFYVKSTTGGSTTITINFSGAGPGNSSAIAEEYSGQLTPDSLDKHNVGLGSTSPTSSGNVTPTVNGELIFGYHFDSVGGQAAGSGFTQRISDAAGLDENLTEDFVQATAATTSATTTYTGGTDYVIWVATFKPPSSSGVFEDDSFRIPPPSPLDPIVSVWG